MDHEEGVLDKEGALILGFYTGFLILVAVLCACLRAWWPA